MKTRLEHDSLGEIQVPADAYYGVQTLRAMVNFKDISGISAAVSDLVGIIFVDACRAAYAVTHDNANA